jgi:hypothetical protein
VCYRWGGELGGALNGSSGENVVGEKINVRWSVERVLAFEREHMCGVCRQQQESGSSSSASVNSDGSRGKGEDGVTLTCGTSQFFNLNQKSNLQRIDSFQTC